MILSETLQNRSQTLAMTYCEVEILTKRKPTFVLTRSSDRLCPNFSQPNFTLTLVY